MVVLMGGVKGLAKHLLPLISKELLAVELAVT